MIFITLLRIIFVKQPSDWKLRPQKVTNNTKSIQCNKETTNALATLKNLGYPYTYDPWRSYINATIGSQVIYKGPIINGWPPGRSRCLPHYIR